MTNNLFSIEDIFGLGKTVNHQAGMQAACLGISLGLAIFGGLLTGQKYIFTNN